MSPPAGAGDVDDDVVVSRLGHVQVVQRQLFGLLQHDGSGADVHARNSLGAPAARWCGRGRWPFMHCLFGQMSS